MRDERIHAVAREISAGQMRSFGPCRSGLDDMGNAVDRLFGEPPVGRDLAAINGQERSLALIEAQDVIAAYVLRPLGAIVIERANAGE